MNIYPYVDTTRANADGSYPVYIIVKNNAGRFFVNTGMTTCEKLIGGRVFSKKDKAWSTKTTLLGKYVSDTERACMQNKLLGKSNAELKAAIQADVFGLIKKDSQATLAEYVSKFANTKRSSTATLYGITERKVRSFDARATFDGVDSEWLERFRQYCIQNGMKVNGAGKELRNIRAVFNWARKKGYTNSYPFLDYSIPEEETLPNNLNVEELRLLRDCPCERWQEKYRDFFMLSFYLAGINPVDLLHLRNGDIKDCHISFVRQKTDKQGASRIRSITLPVVDEAWEIIRKYPSREGFLLGFMDGRVDYHSFVKKCNEALKKIGTSEIVPDKLGKMRKVVYHPLFENLTLYSARYSFGSIAANDLDISEQTIGQCLGHSWSKHVTARYIAKDQRKVDNAVRRVVEYVSGNTKLP